MSRQPFAEHFDRLMRERGLTDADLASAIGRSEAQARRIREGTTASLKLNLALKLCRKLGISPWELAGEREPRASEGEHGSEIRSVASVYKEYDLADEIHRAISDELAALRASGDLVAPQAIVRLAAGLEDLRQIVESRGASDRADHLSTGSKSRDRAPRPTSEME